MAHPTANPLTRAQITANYRARKAGQPEPHEKQARKRWTEIDRKAYVREYISKRTATDAVFAARNREVNRVGAFKRRYGFDFAERDRRIAAQGGTCLICPTVLTDWRASKRTAAVVDHDHTTGEVRGVLCNRCNRAIGMLQDSPELLEAAAAYLRKHNDKAAN